MYTYTYTYIYICVSSIMFQYLCEAAESSARILKIDSFHGSFLKCLKYVEQK